MCFVALTYIIEPQALGEQKSKAAQLGIKRMMEVGVQPHIIACRARNEVNDKVREKIAMFTNVPMRRVFSMHDRESIYTIPESMHAGALDLEILTTLDLHQRVRPMEEDRARRQWGTFVNMLTGQRKYQVHLGITGKYAALRDAYASIDKAIEHCGAHLSAEVDIHWIDTTEMDQAEASAVAGELESLDGVIVPGGFGARGTEGKIACVRYCREHNTPYLGICLGFQMAVVEYARHVCGIGDAASSEFDPDAAHAVIDILPEQKKIEGLGGNMRLGGRDVLVKGGTLAEFLFAEELTAGGKSEKMIRRRFRHRFEVDPDYIDQLENRGLVFSGRHPEHPIMQILELPTAAHPYFIGAQFHPELTSRPLRPSPLFMGLVAGAIRHRYPDTAAEDISRRWLPKAGAKQATGA